MSISAPFLKSSYANAMFNVRKIIGEKAYRDS